MYFNKNNNFYHGIMFHHFHDDKIHLDGQGSINKDQFYKIIKFIGLKNILNAEEFFIRFQEKKLKNNDVCITFDDGIKCQIDVALPVLEDLKIKAFFFVYTSLFSGKPDFLEIFRYFRTNYFEDTESFYSLFFSILDENLEDFFLQNQEAIEIKKTMYPFYSLMDIKFRLVRDYYLNLEKYHNIMFLMFNEKDFNYKKIMDNLFFTKLDLNFLNNLGHTIGLHSHNHPTSIEKLDSMEQKKEYTENLNSISNILNIKKNQIYSMSHPVGSYNNETLEVLSELEIKLGFRDNMKLKKSMECINNSKYEIAREDHTNIINRMRI